MDSNVENLISYTCTSSKTMLANKDFQRLSPRIASLYLSTVHCQPEYQFAIRIDSKFTFVRIQPVFTLCKIIWTHFGLAAMFGSEQFPPPLRLFCVMLMFHMLNHFCVTMAGKDVTWAPPCRAWACCGSSGMVGWGGGGNKRYTRSGCMMAKTL